MEEKQEVEKESYPLQHRLRSEVVWVSFAALLLFILKTWGILPKLGLDEENFNKLVDLALTTLVGIGVLNNPSDPKEF